MPANTEVPADRPERSGFANDMSLPTRHTVAPLSRRHTVQVIGMGGIAALAVSLEDMLAADKRKKKKRRRKRKRRKQRNNAPPTCAEQCSEAFEVCFERAEDSSLCGDTFSTSCKPCFSDQDCVESGEPYCLNLDGLVDRETNEPLTILRSLCGPFLDAVCAQILI